MARTPIGPSNARLPKGLGDVVTPKSPDELFANMKAAGSDEMRFDLDRKPTPGQTFSADGIASVSHSIETFLLARVAAAWEKTTAGLTDEESASAPGPSSLKVEVALTIDGQRLSIGDLRPWYAIPDGEHRVH